MAAMIARQVWKIDFADWFGTPTLLSDRWPVALQVQDLFLEAKGHYRRRGGLPLLVEVGPSVFT